MTIKEIDDAIKELFDDVDALDISNVYEKDNEHYKLVIFLSKFYMEDVKILYTKLIFPVDSNKVKLIKQSFLYLYDINCVYRNVDFKDIYDFKDKLKSIIIKEKFGKSIKILSEFMKYPTNLINDWLSKQNINNINVTHVDYSPKIKIIPCKYLSFDFKIHVNNIEVNLIITKEGKDNFRYGFVYPKIRDKIEKIDLTDMIQTIGISLKNNLLE
jgi:hypothetical protein